jgi:hypothetical protein
MKLKKRVKKQMVQVGDLISEAGQLSAEVYFLFGTVKIKEKKANKIMNKLSDTIDDLDNMSVRLITLKNKLTK